MGPMLWRIIAVAASAVMFVLALPPANIAPLGFVCFVPVLLTVRGKGFAWGFLGGMAVLIAGAALTCTGWFYEPSLVSADPGWNFTGFALFGLAVGLSCALVGEMKSQRSWMPWILAAWAVLLEAALLLYLPAHLALTQYRMYPAMRLASVGGVWLVSYIVWAVNFHIVQSIVERHRVRLAALGAFIGLFAGLGAFMGNVLPGTSKVGIVQTESQDLETLARLNREATERGAKIVVWPELSAMATASGGNTVNLIDLARDNRHAPFVTSFEDNFEPLPYNAAAVFSSEGESARYLKRKLFSSEASVHSRGTEAVAVTVDGVSYGLNICFDSCFPSVMRETASLPEVTMILLPTLDPIGPYGTIQAFHAAYTTFRAAELGVPIARADITAYSMVVDSRGVIVDELGSGVEGFLVADVTLESRDTVYKKYGDWFLFVCGLLAMTGLVAGRTSGRASKTSSLDPA